MRRIKILIATAITMASTGALAGAYQTAPFTVDLDNGVAQGDMLSVRNSANDLDYIGCGIRAFGDSFGGVFKYGFCQAGDANGNTIVCFTYNPSLVDEMRAGNDSSFIVFNWVDDGNGGAECTFVGFSTQSFYLTDVVKGKDK
jgi:hypothetical protein